MYVGKAKYDWSLTRGLAEVVYACRMTIGKSAKSLPRGVCEPFYRKEKEVVDSEQNTRFWDSLERGIIARNKQQDEDDRRKAEALAKKNQI